MEKKHIRKNIFTIIETSETNSGWSKVYDIFMMCIILLSIIPLVFKQKYEVFVYTEYIVTGIFIIDYILRFMTADYKLKKGKLSFLLYPLTPMALIDLAVILSTFFTAAEALKVLKVARLLRTFRVFRTLKFIRYSRNIKIIVAVFKKQSKPLATVIFFALGYVVTAALIIFTVEPNTFKNFFEALYWATISLTTVGYGDLYPVTDIGRIVTMISSILGIAVIALPSAIITAGFMTEMSKYNKDECSEPDNSNVKTDHEIESSLPNDSPEDAEKTSEFSDNETSEK